MNDEELYYHTITESGVNMELFEQTNGCRKRKVRYEWNMRWVEVDTGEVQDHDFGDDLSDLKHYTEWLDDAPTVCFRLFLIRDIWSEAEHIIDRQWAAVQDGQLPTYFEHDWKEQGAKVPVKHHRQLQRNTWATVFSGGK